MCRTRSSSPDTSTHHHEAGSPSTKRMSPGANSTSVPASTSSPTWASDSPANNGNGRSSSTLITSGPASHRRQVPVDEIDRHGALPHGRGHPLHRVEPDVAGREQPRDAG